MGLSDLIAGGMDATAATELLLNVVWTIVGATLVYFMQAGFAMCEAGFTRAKNTGNILMKNMMDFVLGSLFFFIFGFAIMHGTDWNGIIGIKGFFNPTTLADADRLFNGLPIGVFLIFHTVFCATSATIVSGSMAERTKFLAYLLYSAAISIFIYPVPATGSGAVDGSLRWDSTILQVPQQSIWSAVSVHLLVPKSSDLVLENMIKKGMPVRFPDTTFPLQLLAYLFSGSAGSVSTAALPQQLPQTSVISQ